MSGDMLHYAILNGLKPQIASYVTQKAPTTIDDLLSRGTSGYMQRWISLWTVGNSQSYVRLLFSNASSLLLPNQAIMHLRICLFDRAFGLPMRPAQGSYQYSGNTWGSRPETSGFVRGGIYQQRSRFPNQQNFLQSMNQPSSYYPQQRPSVAVCRI